MKKIIVAASIALLATPALARTEQQQQGLEALQQAFGGPNCSHLQSVILEAGELRDEGYPMHRVNNHTLYQIAPEGNAPGDLVFLVRYMIDAMYQHPDQPPEVFGDAVYQGCMDAFL